MISTARVVGIIAACCLVAGILLWLLVFKIWVRGLEENKNQVKLKDSKKISDIYTGGEFPPTDTNIYQKNMD